MAFRIHDSVVRGEIDNRVKGLVRGKIWIHGREEPVVLELKGNAWPDLAGCLLKFTNPSKPDPHPHLETLNPIQEGQIGDITASRKVRVFDIPFEDAYAMCKRGEKPPEHMANSLYMEWFSQQNGRVVIESAEYQLEISEPEWRLTAEENEERARQADDGMSWFMRKISEAIEEQELGRKHPEAEWDEYDYEKFMKECDARTDQYLELLDKYGDSAEGEDKIAEEMGWAEEMPPEEAEEAERRIEEMNRACEEALNEPSPSPEPHREGIDWIRTADGDIRHPLQHRCFASAMRFMDECEALGLDKGDDSDLEQFIFEFQTAAVKLGGALDGVAEGRGPSAPAFMVAYLKRALDHVHKSQAGLEAVAPKKLLPEETVADARKELFEIREGILKLMDEYRRRGND